MSELTLRTVTRTSGANAALKDGTIAPQGFSFAFEEVPDLVQGFRRMVRGLEFDVSEMALTTYLVAKTHGAEFTALPIFLVRGFHHNAIQVLAGSGISSPRDLECRKVGVNRGYTVTTGVWARDVLSQEHRVDIDTVTWVLSGDEHVEAYRPPANVVSMPTGESLESLLRSGELAAVVGANLQAPDIRPLISDPTEAGLAVLQSRGVYPINHLIVVKDEVLKARPGLAAQIFDAFALAKQPYLDRLRNGEAMDDADRTYRRVMEMTGADPLPYGLDPNRTTLEHLLDAAERQRIIDRRVVVDDVFADGTHELQG